MRTRKWSVPNNLGWLAANTRESTWTVFVLRKLEQGRAERGTINDTVQVRWTGAGNLRNQAPRGHHCVNRNKHALRLLVIHRDMHNKPDLAPNSRDCPPHHPLSPLRRHRNPFPVGIYLMARCCITSHDESQSLENSSQRAHFGLIIVWPSHLAIRHQPSQNCLLYSHGIHAPELPSQIPPYTNISPTFPSNACS